MCGRDKNDDQNFSGNFFSFLIEALLHTHENKLYLQSMADNILSCQLSLRVKPEINK